MMLGLGRWMHVNIDNTNLVKGMHHNDLCIACMTIIVVVTTINQPHPG